MTVGGKRCCKLWSGNKNVRVKEVQIIMWKYPVWSLMAFQISTVTGTPRINFYVLIIGSLETALGLYRETGLAKNYLEPESHCFWVGTGQLTALQELLNAFESCFCPSFRQTTLRFKDRCLRGHLEGKWSFSLLRNQFYGPSRKPRNFITKKKVIWNR